MPGWVAPVQERAHPRSRGENSTAPIISASPWGSSPLTRGKLKDSVANIWNSGLIPAHAGKTGTSHGSAPRARAHPRSRGENKATDPITGDLEGSSPLTRGKLAANGVEGYDQRLIPAHAGKTRMRRLPPIATWAHPRSRGENGLAVNQVIDEDGSSPLTRGKHDQPPCLMHSFGLIPAHAGKTQGRQTTPFRNKAHPRSRGENTVDRTTMDQLTGSSPLTRGKRFLTCAFIAQIDQILESLELCASSESYSLMDAYATDAPQDQVRSTGLAPRRSRGAS